MSDECGYRLVMPFVTDDPNFALGFEAGRVYATLLRPDVVDYLDVFNAENDEQLELMATRLGFDTERHLEAEGWVRMRFRRR